MGGDWRHCLSGQWLRGTRMMSISELCAHCLAEGVPRRSIGVAVVVGTILNLINQGDALFGAMPVNLTKIVLTYAVPYCVAT